MDALWIIIFVIAMIFKAVNKGPQTEKDKGWGKGRDWPKGKDWGKWEEWGNWNEPELPPAPSQDRDIPLYQEAGRVDAEFESVKRSTMMPEREPVETRRPELTPEQKPEAGLRPGLPEFNQSTLMNAVIMSEILQPPVSKRKQKNSF